MHARYAVYSSRRRQYSEFGRNREVNLALCRPVLTGETSVSSARVLAGSTDIARWAGALSTLSAAQRLALLCNSIWC
jgi:hypothetical protein